MNKWYLLIFAVAIGISSCALFENFDELPMFIEINEVGLSTNPDQGTNHHNIIDIWPTADGQGIGVFEMPTTFPVLDDDSNTKIFYQAGIKRVGVQDDHTIYPFYNRLEVDYTFAPDSTIVEDLVFTYRDETKIRFAEPFNESHLFIREVDPDSITTIQIVNDDCAEDNCALIVLTPENPEFAASTINRYEGIPIDGTAVYLELEYKTDINLSIGLQSEVNGTDFEQYFLTLTPTETWNKVYIDMAEILLASQLDSYRILIGALSLKEETVEVRVDNIKLLHF